MKTLFISALIFFFSSCAFHYGSMNGNYLPYNLYYKDIALGFSETNQILGLGAADKEVLILDAKKNLYANRPLAAGESYANYLIDFKVTHFLLGRKLKCTVSADVVSDMPEGSYERFSETYKSKIATPRDLLGVDTTNFFITGDSISIGNKTYVVEGLKSQKKVLLSEKSGNTTRFLTENVNNIYQRKKSYKGFELGEIVRIGDFDEVINGFGFNKLRTRNGKGTLSYTKYHKVEKLPKK